MVIMQLSINSTNQLLAHTDVIGTALDQQYQLYCSTLQSNVVKLNSDNTITECIKLSNDTYITTIQCYNSTSDKIIVLGTAAGQLQLYNGNNYKLEKCDTGHTGMITGMIWCIDGSSFMTCGEDGVIKQYSRTGNLRNKLVQCNTSIQAVQYCPYNPDIIIYSYDTSIILKNIINASVKNIEFNTGSIIQRMIWQTTAPYHIYVSCDDNTVKCFSTAGVLHYTTESIDSGISSIFYQHNTNNLFIGTLNGVLCYNAITGQPVGQLQLNDTSMASSVCSLVSNNTQQIIATCTNGITYYCQVNGVVHTFNHYKLNSLNSTQLRLIDGTGDNLSVGERMETNESIVLISLNSTHVVVVTLKSIYIYSIQSLTTPHIVQLKLNTSINVVVQSQRSFITVDNSNVIVSYDYNGTALNTIDKLPGFTNTLISNKNIAFTGDFVVYIDQQTYTQIHIVYANNGQPLYETPLLHNDIITSLQLSYDVKSLVFADIQQSLYLHTIDLLATRSAQTFSKLCMNVSQYEYNTTNNTLCVVTVDHKLFCYLYPTIDSTLLNDTKLTIDTLQLKPNTVITSFHNTLLTLQCSDGSLVYQQIIQCSLIDILINYCNKQQYNSALKLCQLCSMNILWIVLSSVALTNAQIDLVEQCYSILQYNDKLLYIQSIKQISNPVYRTLLIQLYNKSKSLQYVTQQLVSHCLWYEASKLNVDRHEWITALNIAQQSQNDKLIDIVLYHRSRYLLSMMQQESIQQYDKYRLNEIDALKCTNDINELDRSLVKQHNHNNVLNVNWQDSLLSKLGDVTHITNKPYSQPAVMVENDESDMPTINTLEI